MSATVAVVASRNWPPPPGFDPNLARRGHEKIPHVSAGIVVALYVLAATFAQDGPLLLTLSLGPVAGMLLLIYYWNRDTLTPSLVLEQFWAGSVLSIVAASVLELIFQLQTRQIWSCQAHNPDVACDLKFILVVISGVGVVEEVCKLLPMARIHISWLHYLTLHQWWFRLVDSPRPFALMGLFSAAGFAAVENVKYVFSEGISRGVGTSLWRAALAIPFHLACSLYASSTIARVAFGDPSEDWAPATSRAAAAVEEGGISAETRPAAGLAPLLSRMPSGYGGRDWRWEPFETVDINILSWAFALVIPSILHGLYDSGLFLAVQFVSHDDDSKAAALLRALRVALRQSTAAAAETVHGGPSELREALALACVGTSFLCYLAMVVLATKSYHRLPQSPPL